MRYGMAWPLFLILLGVLFLLNQFASGLSIGKTWPVIVIALGVMLFVRSMSPPRPPRGPSV